MDPTAEGVRSFLSEHQARLQHLVQEAHTAYWNSATTGDETAARRYAEAEADVKKLYANRDDAKRVAIWLESGEIHDPQLLRQLTLLHLQYTGNQLPEETIEDLSRRTADLEQTFHTFRSSLEGERVSNNKLLEILREERDSSVRQAAWEASKQVGREVAEPLRELVRRRNTAARARGFADHYAMGLALQEQTEEHLFALLEDFRVRSEVPFRRLRAEMDQTLSRRYGVSVDELRPWHWEDPFSQQAPSAGSVELDPLFAQSDLEAIAREFFGGIGLPVDTVLARSDLWEREGKSQHAFCIDLDREGDVRILCNLRPTEHWMMVLLHELGHAVYDAFIPQSLPFLLRTPSHTLSTEAVAMFMSRLTRDSRWLRAAVGAELSADEAKDVAQQLRAAMLVSARWILVMVHFERELYRNPDRDDLNRLWWDLVERMQLIRRPEGRDEPDWAAKIHLSGAPVYYHNYLLGEWMASQLAIHLEREVLGRQELAGNPRVGEFFRDRLFAHGAELDWNSLLKAATGEGLDPRYFVQQFVDY